MAGNHLSLKAEKRDNFGTGATRALRNSGRTPAIIYGGKQPEQQISLETKELVKQFRSKQMLSQLCKVDVDGKKETFLIRDIQVHPVTDIPQHVDFYRLTKGNKITVLVHLRFINHELSPGIKRGGILNMVRRDIELLCDATSIPHSITVDLAGLQIGESIHASSINIPPGCKPTIERDFTVAAVVGRKQEEEVETTAEGEEGEGGEEGEEDAAEEGAAEEGAEGGEEKSE